MAKKLYVGHLLEKWMADIKKAAFAVHTLDTLLLTIAMTTSTNIIKMQNIMLKQIISLEIKSKYCRTDVGEV